MPKTNGDYPPVSGMLSVMLQEKYKTPPDLADVIALDITIFLNYVGIRLLDTRPELGPGPFPEAAAMILDGVEGDILDAAEGILDVLERMRRFNGSQDETDR
jgi:hypothetical protein